jgi:hypothetical protein
MSRATYYNGGKVGCDLYKLAFKQVEAELRKREPIQSAIVAARTRFR